MDHTMRWLFTLVVAGTLGGCAADDAPDRVFDFVASDVDGSRLDGAAIRCETETRGEGEYVSSWITGKVIDHGNTSYTCLLPGDAAAAFIFVDADDHRVSLYEWSSDAEIPPLRLWRPAVTVAQVTDQVVVSWDAPPPTPGPGWTGTYEVWGDEISVSVSSEDTEASIAVDRFEDRVDPQLVLQAWWAGPGDSELALGGPAMPVIRTPVVPVSRGAGCATIERCDFNNAPSDYTTVYPAGECPFTDGVSAMEWGTGEPCELTSVTVDLGVEQPIGRVYDESDGRRFLVSRDGVSFDRLDESDPLPQPVTARFVRAEAGTPFAEIKVFAPWVAP